MAPARRGPRISPGRAARPATPTTGRPGAGSDNTRRDCSQPRPPCGANTTPPGLSSPPRATEAAKNAPQQAIENVGTAFQNLFRRVKAGDKKPGYPKSKKKGVHDAFRADNGPQTAGADAVPVAAKRVKLPVIGWVRMREAVRLPGQAKSAVASKMADGWRVALAVETEAKPVP